MRRIVVFSLSQWPLQIALLLVVLFLNSLFLLLCFSRGSESGDQYALYSSFVCQEFPEWFSDFAPYLGVIPVLEKTLTARTLAFGSFDRDYEGLTKEMKIRFREAGEEEQILENRFILPVRTVLVTARDYEQFGDEDSGVDFYDRYPNAPGLLAFSKPAFNETRDLAIFRYEYSFCPLCSSGGTVLMHRRWGRWMIKRHYGGWVS